jgi:hypothetical protein
MTSATWTSGGGGGGVSFFEQAAPTDRRKQAIKIGAGLINSRRINSRLLTFTVALQTFAAREFLIFHSVFSKYRNYH